MQFGYISFLPLLTRGNPLSFIPIMRIFENIIRGIIGDSGLKLNTISKTSGISHTYLSNRTTFGTGLDEIDGNTKTEVKVQMRIKL